MPAKRGSKRRSKGSKGKKLSRRVSWAPEVRRKKSASPRRSKRALVRRQLRYRSAFHTDLSVARRSQARINTMPLRNALQQAEAVKDAAAAEAREAAKANMDADVQAALEANVNTAERAVQEAEEALNAVSQEPQRPQQPPPPATPSPPATPPPPPHSPPATPLTRNRGDASTLAQSLRNFQNQLQRLSLESPPPGSSAGGPSAGGSPAGGSPPTMSPTTPGELVRYYDAFLDEINQNNGQYKSDKSYEPESASMTIDKKVQSDINKIIDLMEKREIFNVFEGDVFFICFAQNQDFFISELEFMDDAYVTIGNDATYLSRLFEQIFSSMRYDYIDVCTYDEALRTLLMKMGFSKKGGSALPTLRKSRKRP